MMTAIQSTAEVALRIRQQRARAAYTSPIAIGLIYHAGARCPSCGGSHFSIGRTTAECARCGGAMILSQPQYEVTL